MPEIVANQLKAIAFPNIHRLTEGFTGRSHILNDINHWLQQKDQRFFILTGEPGVGKSAIAPSTGLVIIWQYAAESSFL